MDFSLSEELGMVRDTVREFVQNELLPIEREVLVREKGGSRGAPIPKEKLAHLKKLAVEQGLWAMTAPEALGGGGLPALGACLVAEELGKTFVPFDFGALPPLLYDATPDQQARYVKRLVSGEIECALAVREPQVTSPEKLTTRAVQEGEEWRFAGLKLAKGADLFLVIAQTEGGATCFLVEREWKGVSWQEGQVNFENVGVPASNVLGEVGGAWRLGKPYETADTLQAAARQAGTAARLLEMSAQYARDWKALGQPLAVRPAVQRHLAEMAIDVDAARWLVYHAAGEMDQGHEVKEQTQRAGLFAAEMVQRAVDRTLAIYGGPAHAPDLPILQAGSSGEELEIGRQRAELQRFQIANQLVNA